MLDLQLKPMKAKRRVLITGATGWLGKTLVHSILESGTYNQDELVLAASKNSIMSFKGRPLKVHRLGDLVTECPRFSTVYHFAAVTKDQLSILGTEKFYQLSQTLLAETEAIFEQARPEVFVHASSGAASDVEKNRKEYWEDPYGAMKLEEERRLNLKASTTGSALQVHRIWSLTGKEINKHTSYAIADFVIQADTTSAITIHTQRPTWRRYASAEQLAVLMLNDAATPVDLNRDVGGELVEIRQLANLVCRLVSPSAEVTHRIDDSMDPDDYYSNSQDYEEALSRIRITPMCLTDQIAVVADKLRQRSMNLTSDDF